VDFVLAQSESSDESDQLHSYAVPLSYYVNQMTLSRVAITSVLQRNV
jgi:hypothetical protein